MADAIKKQYLDTKQRIDRSTQAMLANAFRGQQVSQYPNDEPAPELLKGSETQKSVKQTHKNNAAYKALTIQSELKLDT